MHDTSRLIGREFFRVYGRPWTRILDVGSRDVNGTLRPFVPAGCDYVGIDMEPGTGVDVVLDDPYRFPFVSRSFDLVVSTSCFEHDPMFWLTFVEMVRVLRADGTIYINVPSNGPYHAYPMDCWRFYPDAGPALVEWSTRCGEPLALIESFLGPQSADGWIDMCMIFRRRCGEPDVLVRERVLGAQV